MRLFLSYIVPKNVFDNAQINRIVANACFFVFFIFFFSLFSFFCCFCTLDFEFIFWWQQIKIVLGILYITNRPAFVLCLQHIFLCECMCVCVLKRIVLVFLSFDFRFLVLLCFKIHTINTSLQLNITNNVNILYNFRSS